MSRTPNLDAVERIHSLVSPFFSLVRESQVVAAITKDLSAIDAAHAEELDRVRREAYRQGLQSAENQARHLATGCMGKSAEMLLALAEALEARRLEQLNKEARG